MDMLELFQLAFMQRALIVGVATALVSGLISCWIIQMGWSLMGDAISHAVLPGVVLSYLFGLPYIVGALVFAFLTVICIGLIKGTNTIKADTALGIVFTSLFALGTVLISKIPSQTSLSHILFGNLLGVSKEDMIQVLVLGTLVLVVLISLRRDLTLLAFDINHAQAIGISTKFLHGLLLCTLAVSVVTSLQAVGVILSVALLIVPGATARLLSKSMWTMLWLSPTIAVLCTLGGIILSYISNASSGGMIGVVLGATFAVIYCAHIILERRKMSKLAYPFGIYYQNGLQPAKRRGNDSLFYSANARCSGASKGSARCGRASKDRR